MITLGTGHRRLVCVRDEASLAKPKAQLQMAAIAAANPKDVHA
jgi:hypothetical protein